MVILFFFLCSQKCEGGECQHCSASALPKQQHLQRLQASRQQVEQSNPQPQTLTLEKTTDNNTTTATTTTGSDNQNNNNDDHSNNSNNSSSSSTTDTNNDKTEQQSTDKNENTSENASNSDTNKESSTADSSSGNDNKTTSNGNSNNSDNSDIQDTTNNNNNKDTNSNNNNSSDNNNSNTGKNENDEKNGPEMWYIQGDNVTAHEEETVVTIEDDFSFFALSNATHLSYNTLIAPYAHGCDGSMELLFAKKLNRVKMTRLLTGLEDATHLKVPGVEYHKVKALILEPSNPSEGHLMLDGEPIPVGKVKVESHCSLARILRL